MELDYEDEKAIGCYVVEVKNRIIDNFSESDWTELGMLTGWLSKIEGHSRLLRSMRFGDDDYGACILEVIHSMISSDTDNIDQIDRYLNLKYPELDEGVNISSEIREKTIVFSPTAFEVPEEEADDWLISIMMPFDTRFDRVHKTISSAAEEAGFNPQRADNIWEHSTVIQDVFNLIFRSYIVVCDFSKRNSNVFYEAGIAHTLGKHVVPIAQQDSDIPFDLRHHRHVVYHNNDEGCEVLKEKLLDRFKTLENRRT